MLNLDPAKLLVIAVVAVILLGPNRLPLVARQIGAAWRSLGEFRHRIESEARSSIPDLPSSMEIARLARSPSALLNHLSKMSSDSGEVEETLTQPAPGEPLRNEVSHSLYISLPTAANKSPQLDTFDPGDPGLN